LYGAAEEHVILPYQGTISNKHRLNDFLWNTVLDFYEKDVEDETSTSPPPSPPPPTQQSWFERKTGKKHKHRKTEFETQTTGLLKIPVMYPSKEMGIHGPIADIAFMSTGYYEDPEEFLKDLNNTLNNKIFQMLKKARADEGKYLWVNPRDDIRYVKFYREKGKVIFQVPDWVAYSPVLGLSIKLSPELQYIMGFIPFTTMDYGEFKVLAVKTPSSFDIDVSRNPLSSLWIFSDIVQPSYVKDTLRPLLRCIVLDRRSTQISHESVSNLQYKTLCANNVQRIKIWIAEDYRGEALFSNTKTHIRLDFIKMNET